VLLIGSFVVQGVAVLSAIGLRVFTPMLRGLSWANATPALAFGLVALYGCLFVGYGVLSSRAARTQNAEVAAGYTTMLSEFDQVDGVDSRTRQVVRPAVRQSPEAPRPGTITSGAERGEFGGVQSPVQVAIALRYPAIGFVIAALILVAAIVLVIASRVTDFSLLGLQAIVVLLAPVSLLAVLFIPVLIRSLIAPSRTLAAVVSHFPNAQVYVGEMSDGDKATELLDSSVPRLPGAQYRSPTYFVFDREYLTMYSQQANRIVPFLAIPRSRVTAARAASVGGSSVWPELTVQKNNGRFVELVLELGGASSQTSEDALAAICANVVAWRSAPA
jgi:hypothetical protein